MWLHLWKHIGTTKKRKKRKKWARAIMRWKRAKNLAQRCYLRSLRSFVEKLATKQQFPAPWISARSSRPGNFLGRLTPKKSTLWLIAEIHGWLAWVTSWLIITTRCCNASSLRQAAIVYGGDSSHCILVDAYPQVQPTFFERNGTGCEYRYHGQPSFTAFYELIPGYLPF